MPGNTLIQILNVTVPAASSLVVAHNLNVNGTPVKPDEIQIDRLGSGLDVDPAFVTTTSIRVDNPTAAGITANVLLTAWHTILRQFGNGANGAFQGLVPQPFVATGGGGGGTSGNPEAFVYIATGLEGSDFFVPLPAARSNDNYAVFAQGDGETNILGFDCPNILPADRTTTQFRVVSTGAVTAADRIAFFLFNF